MTDERPPPLRFDLDVTGDRLTVHFEPPPDAASSPGRSTLLDALMDAGYGDLYLPEDAVARFVELAERATLPFELEVAERRHGRCRVAVAKDAMSATVEVDPPFGGLPVEKDAVRRALAGAGVVSGILDDRIQAALADTPGQPYVVARGRLAEAGTAAQFINLIPDVQQCGPRVDARGIADYRELGKLVIVHAGDPLMRRVPPTPGVAGRNVLGAEIPATEHEDTPFSPSISGASPAADDPNLLIASIGGQPVLLPHGVSVLPTIDVAAVDLVTGNIEFEGTVNIKGHVASGMRVVATGDVFVGGHVEAAYIEAGGDIVVAAGAIGRVDANEPGKASRARLVAGGTVSVLFCEHALVQAGGDVQIGEVSLHSEMTAGQQILIGKPAGRRSQLIGGIARCSVLLQVGTLGSSAAVGTEVEVGFNPQSFAQLDAVHKQIQDTITRMKSVQQVLSYTEASGAPHHTKIRERAQRTLEASEREHDALLQMQEAAQAQVVLIAHARVAVRQTVHPNVDIRIGGKCFRTQETAGARTYELKDGEIVLAAE